jgi:hypothetical protein
MTQTTTLLRHVSLFGIACLISGCDPAPPSRQELGRIVFNEADVPGADKPYVVPEYLLELKPNEQMNEQRPPGE